MKRKKKTVVFDLSSQIRLTLNEHMVKFATVDGEWEVAFGGDSREYQQILYLIKNKELTALQNLSAFLYFTKLIVSNVDFCNKYNTILDEFLAENEKEKHVDEKKDALTLAEEKALHEKTAEAVEELEDAKKDYDE